MAAGPLLAVGAGLVLAQAALLVVVYRWVRGRFAAVTDHRSFRAFRAVYAAGAALLTAGLVVALGAVVGSGTVTAVSAVRTGTVAWLAGGGTVLASFLAARWMDRERQRRAD